LHTAQHHECEHREDNAYRPPDGQHAGIPIGILNVV
jgi:hypothetical protein